MKRCIKLTRRDFSKHGSSCNVNKEKQRLTSRQWIHSFIALTKSMLKGNAFLLHQNLIYYLLYSSNDAIG